MSSAVKAKLTTKVMTNWIILTTSMGFQALRKEGCRRRSEARERLRRLRTPALSTDADQRDKCDSRRPQPQRLNKGTKKRRNCKHKKSGCACFIVARLRASALRNRVHRGQQGLVRTDEFDSKVTNLRKNLQEPSQQKTETFFSIELSTGQNAGERNKTARPSQQTRELFSIFSPLRSSPHHPIRSHPIAVARTRPRACTRIQSFFDYSLHRSPPPPISLNM